MLVAEIWDQDEDTGQPVKLGRIWWDGRRVNSDPPTVPVMRESIFVGGKFLTPQDGEKFVRGLPEQYRNPYFFAKLVGNG